MIKHNRSKVYYSIIILLSLIAFIIGIIYGHIIINSGNYNIKEPIILFYNNLYGYHPTISIYGIIILPLVSILSFLIIGPIINIVYILYMFFNSGFVTILILNNIGVSSIFFCILFNIMYIIVPALIISLYTYYLFKIMLFFLNRYFNKTSNIHYTVVHKYLKRLLFIYIIYFLYTVICFFFGNYLLKIIAFL